MSGFGLATTARFRRWVALATAVSGVAAPVALGLHAAFEGWVWLAVGTAMAVAVVLGVGGLILSFAYESLQRVKQLESGADRTRIQLTDVGDALAYQRSRLSETDGRVIALGAEVERSFEAVQGLGTATANRLVGVEGDVARVHSSVGNVWERLPRMEESIRRDVTAAQAAGAARDKLVRDLARNARTSADSLWRQTEALFGLYATLQPPMPLPPTRGWAMSPDILSFIISEVLFRDRSSVLEFGSGVSTLLIALALERKGSGSVVSIDHDAAYGAQTVSLLEAFGLSHRAEVRIARPTAINVGGETWQWYDTAQIPTDVEVDLVTVDGPVGREGTLVRYPALPVMHDLLVPGAVIVLDDAKREAEQQIAERWRTEFPDFSFRVLNHEKGTLVGERAVLNT